MDKVNLLCCQILFCSHIRCTVSIAGHVLAKVNLLRCQILFCSHVRFEYFCNLFDVLISCSFVIFFVVDSGAQEGDTKSEIWEI